MSIKSYEPLAAKIRPTSIHDFIGQNHLVGLGKPLTLAIERKQLISMIFWGPPGVGKTTLGRIYASEIGAKFAELSAVSAGKADIKKIIDLSSKMNNPIVLFLDEIHRFNKAQQDYLLPYVERGTIILIGATTENPSFEVISPLLSRCRVFVLHELKSDEMSQVISRAIKELNQIRTTKFSIDKKARDWLISMANGDARQAITMLENTSSLYSEITIESLKNTLQSKHLRFDRQGEEHYNTISAFIKSMRASDPNAAIYYLARMIESGEDPLFIARRMIIFASEDIGVVQPTALVVANEVFRACEVIGYPECSINLAHGTIYLSQSKKDRSAYDAFRSAQNDVKLLGNLPIPMNLRNAPTRLMKSLGYGKGYEMYTTTSLLPSELQNKKYF